MGIFRKVSSPQAPALRGKAEDAAAHLETLMIQAEKAAANILHGEHRQKRHGPGERFWQFREYDPSDRPQDIDWRQSGKTDKIFVRQKEWQTTQSTYLWCNGAPGMDFSSRATLNTKADTAKIITLALSILMTRAGEQVGILGEQRTGRSEAALRGIEDFLLGTAPDASPLPNVNISIPRRSGLVLAGDFLDEPASIEKCFKTLSAQSAGGIVIQVLDPAELELPYQGRVIFDMPGLSERELVNNVSSIRDAYKKRISEHIHFVQTLSKNCKWDYFLHPTDREIRDTLTKIWKAINVDAFAAKGNPR